MCLGGLPLEDDPAIDDRYVDGALNSNLGKPSTELGATEATRHVLQPVLDGVGCDSIVVFVSVVESIAVVHQCRGGGWDHGVRVGHCCAPNTKIRGGR